MTASLKFLTLAEVPSQDVCEFRPAFPWIGVILIGGMAGGSAWGALTEGHFFAWWLTFILCGFWLLIVHRDAKIRHESSWLVRADTKGLYIKWRSYQNHHMGPEGVQVVFVPYAFIASAQRHKKHWYTPDSRHGGNRDVNYTFLELTLCNEIGIDYLKQCIAGDRAAKPAHNHYPVSIEDNAILRIEWNARPRINRILEVLRKAGVCITPAKHSEADLISHGSEKEMEELARRGELMALIRVIRVKENLSLVDARHRAQELIDGVVSTHPSK